MYNWHTHHQPVAFSSPLQLFDKYTASRNGKSCEVGQRVCKDPFRREKLWHKISLAQDLQAKTNERAGLLGFVVVGNGAQTLTLDAFKSTSDTKVFNFFWCWPWGKWPQVLQGSAALPPFPWASPSTSRDAPAAEVSQKHSKVPKTAPRPLLQQVGHPLLCSGSPPSPLALQGPQERQRELNQTCGNLWQVPGEPDEHFSGNSSQINAVFLKLKYSKRSWWVWWHLHWESAQLDHFNTSSHFDIHIIMILISHYIQLNVFYNVSDL